MDKLKSIIEKIKKFWNEKNKDAKRNIIISIIVILSAVICIYLVGTHQSEQFLLSSDDQQVLSNVVSELKTKNIKYSVRGKSIYVKYSNIDELRLEIPSSESLSNNSGTSLSLFEKPFTFMSDSQESLIENNYLEEKIANTIKAYSEIKSASVSIAKGNDSPFKDENTKTKVGVVLSLKSPITQKQINSIQSFVAAAVPNTDKDNVVITDTTGKNLTSEEGQYDDNSSVVEKNVEDRISEKIKELLSPEYGENIRIVTTVHMNFDQTKTHKETVQSGPDTVVSEQITGNGSNEQQASGQAGTASNVPSYQSSSTGSSGSTGSGDKSETINYALNKTIEEIVKQPSITNISVAVTLNKNVDSSEINKIENLISTAALIDEGRGDKVTVESFTPRNTKENSLDDSTKNYIMDFIANKMVSIIAILLAFIFGIILIKSIKGGNKNMKERIDKNPAVKQTVVPNDNKTDEMIESFVDMEAVEKRKKEMEELKKDNDVRLKIKGTMQSNPSAVAGTIKSWINDMNK